MAPAMVLMSVVLPLLEFAGDAIDLAASDGQTDIVDRAHFAIDAEEESPVIGFEVFDLDHSVHN